MHLRQAINFCTATSFSIQDSNNAGVTFVSLIIVQVLQLLAHRWCPKLCRLLSETVGLPNKQHDIATKRNFSIPSKFNRIQQFISSNIESDDFWELMFYMRCCTVWSWYLCEALHNSIMTSYLAPELQICDKICFSKHVRSCNLTE